MNVTHDPTGDDRAIEHVGASVLLVEDDADLRETLRIALEDEGYAVSEAEDGLEALAMLRTSVTPLIVVLDLRLPRLNGDALLRRVTMYERLPAQHSYLLVTASRELLTPASLRLLKRMDVRIIPKPFELDDLLRLVSDAADDPSATAH